MASAGSTQALILKRKAEQALMPPPPTKHIKRPTEVLDEDVYTEALEEIIARDYFPGLRETKAQEEYLAALESKNEDWIRAAGRKLRQSIGPDSVKQIRRSTRDSRFDTPKSYKRAADTPSETPRSSVGADTPVSIISDAESSTAPDEPQVDTSIISLSDFQGRYTSEDNESFNTVLDKQNDKKRLRHAHLYTPDQRILTQRQITHRAAQQALLREKSEYETANGKALISLSTGATDERSAKPDSWKTTGPANNLMFLPQSSVDERGVQTVAEIKEAMSRAGPKEIVLENTRFPANSLRYGAVDDDDDDDTASIHTSALVHPSQAPSTMAGIGGGDTPRVNGYEYVDDEEEPAASGVADQPSYRDLLAGQAVEVTPNPFQLKGNRRREELHHRLVEKEAEKKRAKAKQSVVDKRAGSMTPAAQTLLAKLGGKTPTPSTRNVDTSRKEMWTPVATPRRSRVGAR